MEYLILIQSGTLDDSLDLRIQTMLAMLTCITQRRNDFKIYDELYYNIVMDYMKEYGKTEKEEAHKMLTGLMKDGYEEWEKTLIRKEKLNKIVNNLK